MATKKLFWQDSYAAECTARVTAIEGRKVKVDQTIFYAFSGGQHSDEGTIGGINVVEAVKQGDKENIIDIEYTLEREPDFKVGDIVEIKINPERRANLRRLHSAIHIVYYFVEQKLGKFKTVGSDVSPEKAKIEIAWETPITPLLPDIERVANQFLAEHHPIITKFDEVKQDLRWWICEQWKMPCGGTHVKNTSEIGRIALQRVNKGKGKERIDLTLVGL